MTPRAEEFTYQVGDAVDFYSAATWKPGTVVETNNASRYARICDGAGKVSIIGVDCIRPG